MPLPTIDWNALRRRGELLAAVREFFSARGFLEVETPLLADETVVDRHLDPIGVTLLDDPRRPADTRLAWLQTSPEAAMKRLMIGGGEAIYQVTRSFRAGERGPLHATEFTIVEWYRRGDSYETGMDLLDELCQALLRRGPAERRTYADAMRAHAAVDPHTDSVDRLAAAVRPNQIAAPASLAPDDRDGWLELLLVHCVESHLGQQRPTILFDWPVGQAALARIRDDDPPVAERFELYVDGVELANGYHEIADTDELRARFERANRQRQSDGKPPLPTPERFLAAHEHGLPPCAGCALGFDRLVMVASGGDSIGAVGRFDPAAG